MLTNVLDYLDRSVTLYPEKIALSDSKNEATYAEFGEKSDAIGSAIIERSGTKNSPIVVFIDRNIESVISFMGIAKSGNFYVPIDRQLPVKRVELIVETLQPKAAIIWDKDNRILDEINFSGERILYEEAILHKVNADALNAVREKSIDTDPLYAIFTSGSTGVPKGVLVCHRSVIDLIENFAETFDFDDTRVFGNQAPFDFDVSVKDIYSCIRNGGSMHVIPKLFFSFPAKLIACINERKINTIIWATSALRIIENLNALEKTLPETLKTIMFSGEVMPNKVLNYWRNKLPDVSYVNLYGPTEITCNCLYYKVDRPFNDEDALPIGVAFKNTDILLLDGDNLITEPGIKGEICVRGTSLAHGYYNNHEKTAEAFCQNPLNKAYPELIYRTGDLAKYGEDGLIYFVSRKDYQIKHMGHRIELSEVEIAINSLPYIDAGCCIYDKTNEQIVLFYQSANECERDIMKDGTKLLPKYMMPNRFIHFTELPMTKNAKIDRVKLKGEYLDNDKD
ncbi:MAG: amino acid adenylation domain-containing protein [Clostridia bacterium]|nr:amino acid adenylation domain-containing protein [Clostridia bacterium]